MPYYPATASHIRNEIRHPAVTTEEIKIYEAYINRVGPRTKEEWERAQKLMHELYFAITGLDWE